MTCHGLAEGVSQLKDLSPHNQYGKTHHPRAKLPAREACRIVLENIWIITPDYQLSFRFFLVSCYCCSSRYCLVGLLVKVFTSTAADLGSITCFSMGSFPGRVHSSGYPARRLALQSQIWDWFALCQYAVTGWDRMFDL